MTPHGDPQSQTPPLPAAGAEGALSQAQRMEAMGELAARVAHDFNNLLAGINISLFLLRQDPAMEGQAQENLDDLEAGIGRAAGLVRGLVRFSGRSAMVPRELDLNAVVGALMDRLGGQLGGSIALAFEPGEGVPRVAGDAAMLAELLTELAMNARDAMPQGGRVTLGTGAAVIRPERAAEHGERRPGRFAVLSVTDSGCGMAEGTLQRIFEPFFTTRKGGEGAGLGLAAVHGIVRQHRGWVEVSSRPGAGSTFQVYLPACALEHPAFPAAAAAPETRGGGACILLVEDEEAIRAHMRGLLEGQGYQVLEASRGEDALALWARPEGPVDLLVTDMVMPGGIGGAELARRIRAEQPGLKAVFISGCSPEGPVPGSSAEAALSRFLQKPFSSQDLVSAVRELLDAGPSGPA